MDLLTYISDMGRRRALADAVNKSPDYLWQVATDRRKASTTLATDIDKATAGVVTRQSLRPDVWDSQPRARPKPKSKAA